LQISPTCRFHQLSDFTQFHFDFHPVSLLSFRKFPDCDTDFCWVAQFATHTLSLSHPHAHARIHKYVKNCCIWARGGRCRTTIARETFWELFNKIIEINTLWQHFCAHYASKLLILSKKITPTNSPVHFHPHIFTRAFSPTCFHPHIFTHLFSPAIFHPK